MVKVLKVIVLVVLAAFAALLLWVNAGLLKESNDAQVIAPRAETETTPTPEPTEAPVVYTDGFVASAGEEVWLCDSGFASTEMLTRGENIACDTENPVENGESIYYAAISAAGTEGYLAAECFVRELESCVTESQVFVRTPTVFYLAADGIEIDCDRLAEKGDCLQVLGFDTLSSDGSVRMYYVADEDGNEGYIRAEYVTGDEQAANAVYDEELQQLHYQRGDKYGGGDPGELDYFPRDKEFEANTAMPETCKTLFIPCYSECIQNYQEYIDVADSCGINAFCVDICDGCSIGYPSAVMEEYSPASYNAANNSLEDYRTAVTALKEAGYYVIGRMTVFNDELCYFDNMDWGITNPDGSKKMEDASYFLSAFVREVWQYKLAIALEAAEEFGFDEIQFDYVRFPADTYDSEASGNIDFKNKFNETKVQAIQRFLMYAADNLHEAGIWVSADVFGETSNDYSTHYGQYWPAISNVVDVISAMPYPDHYNSMDGWNPWEHPYELMKEYFAAGVLQRQTECPTPARVRTWIQCYDSIKSPKVYYYADNVGAEIRGLFDAGLTDGYLTWNAGGDWARYRDCSSAFDIDPDTE